MAGKEKTNPWKSFDFLEIFRVEGEERASFVLDFESVPNGIGQTPIVCIRDQTDPLNSVFLCRARKARILNLLAISFNRS